MRTLTFLHNHLKGAIAWLIKDEMGVVYEKGTASTFSELQAKDVDRLEGFIFSPLFSNKRLEVPPASTSQILESIPFLSMSIQIRVSKTIIRLCSKSEPIGCTE